MRHIRYEKDNVGWIELRETISGVLVESRGQWFNGAGWNWQPTHHIDILKAEGYWDDQGYNKTVFNEGPGPLKSTVLGSVEAEFPTNDIDKKHKCICKWEDVYREGCK